MGAGRKGGNMTDNELVRDAADSMYEAAKALEKGKPDSVVHDHAAEALAIMYETANDPQRDALIDDIELYIRQLKEEGHMHAINARTIARELHSVADNDEAALWDFEQERKSK